MIAAMNAGGVSLGGKHYSLMAKLDGERTASLRAQVPCRQDTR
jgi:hypothetical protein